ncbi:ACP S-malonyltransferase [Treponema succinifaciens]|uniref:Malonyl CoA-acyl carrier protein transacylase n=1 Tax=Treponema succinifaciens (strain ATCC 33096 / DSM 2489 / 6091) TaxID=869209 RepID=F2NX23_TRES6|nr:ACP S-malonyltransferase [Treponema succinifaciens]AEB13358.1 (Acyl-carrier-protein) S-malonyltransferase [Treponema succinifaciens DSM 2489]
MAEKYAFLFPGQGAQAPGMVKDVAESFSSAKKVIDDVSSIINLDMAKLLWESDAAELSRSDNSQIAITAASLALMAALKDKNIEPSAAMGFSLGEFPALYAAGVLSFEDVVKVVRQRGLIMQKVCEEIAAKNEGHAPGMTAVLGLPPEKVKEIASGIKDAYAANMNSVKQTVVSGTFDALAAVEKAASEAGARRAVRLKVAGPFHSPLMQDAAVEFEKAIADVNFNDPKIKLFSNVTGKECVSGEEAKKSAVLHLTNPVLWTDEEDCLASVMKADGFDKWAALEVGPGKVLSGLWGNTDYNASIAVLPVNTTESVNNL